VSSARRDCIFCRIIAGEQAAARVFEDELTLAFLDHTPLFPGHVLLVPKAHIETFVELPHDRIAPFFSNGQRIVRAIEQAMDADGSFVAMNNKVSQSVPHLHLHLVPRKRKDGLRGFFWPRQKYGSEEAKSEIAQRIALCIATRGQMP
jgi:histidine triad (HIT) family protein